MKVIEELLKWAESLPAWQSDALRRIWTQESLTDEDINDLYSMLKVEHGLIDDKLKKTPIKFSKDHIGSGSIHGKDTILKSIYNLNNINAIDSSQGIKFGHSGVTVIYGSNASGKSGFSRVLKRACRARGVIETIYPNIFAKEQSSESAKASFDVNVEDEGNLSVVWEDGKTVPECLANIAVFDSKTARVYVDGANEVSYIPYGLDVFTKLADICTLFKEKLSQEISSIPVAPSVVFELVGEGKIIEKLSATTTEEYINNVAIFEKKDQVRLDELTKIVVDYQANDPQKKAENTRRQKARVDKLRTDLININQSLSGKAVKVLHDLWSEAKISHEASQLASKEAFSSEPLDGTGNLVWKSLFDASKKFSNEFAYPLKSFPVIDTDSRCVLCQQILDDNAKDRIKRFWEFIQHDTAKTAHLKRDEFLASFEKFKNIDIDPLQRDVQLIEEIRGISKEITIEVEKYVPCFLLRVNGVKQAVNDGNWDAIPELSDYSSVGLSAISKQLEAEAKKSDAIANPVEQEKVKNELSLLCDRKKLFDNKNVLTDQIKNFKIESILKRCLNAVNTRNISIKQSQLMEQALTKELETALNKEFKELGVGHIPLRLKKSSSVGSTFHQLQFPTSTSGSVNLSDVLSEGEHRVVAIASFLGELSTSSHKCGIIFDDPVCSLDHLWRNKVARRLVTEGNSRQVIIFTHDIVFLLALQKESELQEIPLVTQTVRRAGKQAGICDSSLPWLAKNTKDRLGYLKQFHQDLTKAHKQGEIELYKNQVPQFYSLLRETWERAIEEVLLNDSIQRFRPSLETQRLKIVNVTDEDYARMNKGMDKCSSLLSGHDQAPAIGESVISPEDLLTDVKELEDFVSEIRKRQKETIDKRKMKL